MKVNLNLFHFLSKTNKYLVLQKQKYSLHTFIIYSSRSKTVSTRNHCIQNEICLLIELLAHTYFFPNQEQAFVVKKDEI